MEHFIAWNILHSHEASRKFGRCLSISSISLSVNLSQASQLAFVSSGLFGWSIFFQVADLFFIFPLVSCPARKFFSADLIADILTGKEDCIEYSQFQ